MQANSNSFISRQQYFPKPVLTLFEAGYRLNYKRGGQVPVRFTVTLRLGNA